MPTRPSWTRTGARQFNFPSGWGVPTSTPSSPNRSSRTSTSTARPSGSTAACASRRRAPEPVTERSAAPDIGPEASILDLLELERIDPDLFRASYVFQEEWALYGGQVAAQALLAAGLSVEPNRLPHSLHGYFLRPGDASRPVVFQVFRDRDGRSYSARRVVALQNGRVIFNMAASFQRSGCSPVDATESRAPQTSGPQEAMRHEIPRLASYEGRTAQQPFPDLAFPTRFWARCTADLPDDPLLHAATLTYLSDISTGLVRFDDEDFSSSSSLDHALWFHRPIDATEWTLMDCVPHTVANGRGFYSGSLWAHDGTLLASLTQEALFRQRKPKPRSISQQGRP